MDVYEKFSDYEKTLIDDIERIVTDARIGNAQGTRLILFLSFVLC
ncbi:hypothetical protein BOFE_09360 (plasmid) [Candidatus Borrelia fainii]|uniref:Uncharacterized protein n=1 Tax=Candidatus Borrelia fainii TaxID=2518322 RepID=A0ABM8DLK4_9SPIR|nr:hypothetical protein [Candidatus Borrelia fainii]BDU63396.1 hypothetical protein BOFE_09360 [Candidatus Borrelia fainii]